MSDEGLFSQSALAEAALEYRPVLRDASVLLETRQFERVLVVGGRLFPGSEYGLRLRLLSTTEVEFPTGVYVFRTSGEHWAMVVQEGSPPSTPLKSSWDDPDDDPLVVAYQWFESWWLEAPEIPRPMFAVGDQVLLTPENLEGVIRSREFDLGEWFYSVRTKGRTIDVRETGLQPPITDDDPDHWIQRIPDQVDKLAATVTRAKLTEQLTDTVYSFRASRTVFRPYQFRPVLKLLESGRLRLLVADEVGLGKTIEAGLLWTELDARRQANRVLIVSPSGLVEKWKAEMSQRFGYELEELGSQQLTHLLEKFESDRFPARFHAIVSVERLRIWNGLERLAEIGPRFDLVIVDEAHVFRNSGTRSHALGSLLSDWADALVFLSATPLNLGNNDLFNLLELLSPADFDDRQVLERILEPNAVLNRISETLLDTSVTPNQRLTLLDSLEGLTFGNNVVRRAEYRELRSLLQRPLDSKAVVQGRQLLRRLHALEAVVTRTRKTEVQEERTVREPIAMNVRWTPREAELYHQYDAWQRQRAKARGIPAGFAMQMPMRLASTCLPAARDRVLALATASTAVDFGFEGEEFDELLESDNSEDEVLELPPPEVLQAALALGDTDTKYEVFLEALLPIVRSGKRVLVFSFSRPTIAYLHERLRHSLSVEVMHGGVSREERAELMAAFRRGEFMVMLASRVASEGLDFEFCSAVVNYDLPWNPMEVEQRIGRADRFGQREEKILVLNFHTPGTIETDIIERVHQRIGVFTSSIGELEPILRENLGELRKTIFDYELSEEQRLNRLNATMAAIEEQKVALEEVERASGLLTSTDTAEIEGLEKDLVSSGRYIGQEELVLLLKAWVSKTQEAKLVVSEDGKTLHLSGSPELELDLRLVQSDGERSAEELDYLATRVRRGIDVHISLDQEHARTTGLPLLTANHPFVRAAIASGTHGLSRFGCLRLRSENQLAGTFLCLLSIARWRGIRSSNELWTSVINVETLEEATAVGDLVLSTLADGRWKETQLPTRNYGDALREAVSVARKRRLHEESQRAETNSRLTETRLLSVEETFRRKRAVIEKRIDTARRNQSDIAVRLGESQLLLQERLEAETRRDLENNYRYSMEVEHLAVCVVEVMK